MPRPCRSSSWSKATTSAVTSKFGPWAIAIAVAVAAAFALFGSPQVEAPLGRGAVAPDFSLPRVGGETMSLEGCAARSCW